MINILKQYRLKRTIKTGEALLRHLDDTLNANRVDPLTIGEGHAPAFIALMASGCRVATRVAIARKELARG